MALIYKKYIMSVDHCWYDSSNIKYSECFNTQDDTPKVVKVVFKEGRTYIYRDVDVSKYVMFRDAASQGLAFGMTLKNCPFERVDDTPMESLDKLLEEFRRMDSQQGERNVELCINNETGEFVVKVNGVPMYDGFEGKVSVVNLFAALGIVYTLSEDNGLHVTTKEDFENRKLQ